MENCNQFFGMEQINELIPISLKLIKYPNSEIQTEISNPYKNDLIKQSIEEINIHLNNNLDTLRKKIQIFIADNGIKIYKIEDLNKELNNIYETIKQELSNQIKLQVYNQLF